MLATLEPVGVDRLNTLLAVLCSAATWGKMNAHEFMFDPRPIDNHALLQSWMAANAGMIHKVEDN